MTRPPATLVCSLCGSAAPAATGSQFAAHDECPGCRLRIRHRALGAYLALAGDPTRTGRTLACCLTPEERRYCFPAVHELVNFDIRPLGFTDLQMDVQDMRVVADASIDCFLAIHVFQHVADDTRAMAEIRRVLRPGSGLMLASVPFRRGQPTQKMEDVAGHYGAAALAQFNVGVFRRYGLEDFRARLDRHFALAEFAFADPLVDETEIIFEARRPA